MSAGLVDAFDASTKFAIKALEACPDENFLMGPMGAVLCLAGLVPFLPAGARDTILSLFQSGGATEEAVKGFLESMTKNDGCVRVSSLLAFRETSSFLTRFQDAIPKSGLPVVLFKDESDAVQIINDAVAKATEGRMTRVMTTESVRSFLLLNILSFRGKWTFPFTEQAVKQFYGPEGRIDHVPYMLQTETFRYAERDDFRIAALPLTDGSEFVIFLPMGWDDDPRKLPPQLLKEVRTIGTPTALELMIPQFGYETEKINLRQLSESCGLASVFQEIEGQDIIFEQATKIDVDLNGVVADTATYFGYSSGMSDDDSPVRFAVTHPFVYAITDATGILFIGYLGKAPQVGYDELPPSGIIYDRLEDI